MDFLGKVLGPDFEIALHEIDTENQSIIAIANGHVSGRGVGAPITDLGLQMIKNKIYEKNDYILNYKGISRTGKILRSSTIFIKDDDGSLLGMLCINFDDSRYLNISRQVLQLCQSHFSSQDDLTLLSEPNTLSDAVENFPETLKEVIETVLNDYLKTHNIPGDRLTQTEKIQIVDLLNQKGIFLLKGSVSQVSKKLHCSEPTVYRYLGTINSGKA